MSEPDIYELQAQVTLAQEVDRLRAFEQRMRWQPIETAPKDGTWVFLRCKSLVFPKIYRSSVSRWSSSHMCWMTTEAEDFAYYGDEPTHWMPLPEEA